MSSLTCLCLIFRAAAACQGNSIALPWYHSYSTFPSHLPPPHPPLVQHDGRRETSCRCLAGCAGSPPGKAQGRYPRGFSGQKLLNFTSMRTDQGSSSNKQKPMCCTCILPQTAARVTVIIYQLPAPNTAGVHESKSQRNAPACRAGDSPTKAVLV